MTQVLIDTSIWIGHLRKSNTALASLLGDNRAAIHPFVIGELACGELKFREEILALLNILPQGKQGSHEEVMAFVESRKLYGAGVGWIDSHLLASALISGFTLWTADKYLDRAALKLGISFLAT